MLSLPHTSFTFDKRPLHEKISLRDTLSYSEKLANQTAEQVTRSVDEFIQERTGLLKQWRQRKH